MAEIEESRPCLCPVGTADTAVPRPFSLDLSQPIREKVARSVKRESQEYDGGPESAGMEIVPTQAGYDRWAQWYDGEDNPLVLLEEQHFGPLAGDVARLTVADIGCGTGRNALRWAAAGARVTALDFSEAMLSAPAPSLAPGPLPSSAMTWPNRSRCAAGPLTGCSVAWCSITSLSWAASSSNCAGSAGLRVA